MEILAWLRNMVAFERPIKEQFNVADPTAIGKEIRSITLAFTPPDEEAQSSIVSLYWSDSQQKIFEKNLDSEEEASALFTTLQKDLLEVVTLTNENKLDAASNLMTELQKKYDIKTDPIIEGNPPPITTTNASLDSSDEANMEKQAKIVMQNIFFDNPDQVIEYQEKMKAGAPQGEGQGEPPLGEKLPGLDEIPEDEGEENLDEGLFDDDELAPPSLSYEQVEKNKANEAKNMSKRIENEVKEQIQSALDEKIATLFTTKDDELVTALRGVGRTWEEVSDYLKKELKYEKEGVDAYIDQWRQKETGMPSEEPKPEPPAPPSDLVTPETHDKLVKEVEEEEVPKAEEPEPLPEEELPLPEEAPMPEEASLMASEIYPVQNEILKVALEPLEEPPTLEDEPMARPLDMDIEDPLEERPISENMDEMPMDEDEIPQDARVYVMSDYDSATGGYEGTFLSKYTYKGDDYAIISTDDGEIKEEPLHKVTLAAKHTAKLEKEAKEKEEAEKVAVQAELNSITQETLKLIKEATETLEKEAEPFVHPSYHGECPICKRDSDMKDLGNGTSKCSWCGTVTPNKTLETPPGNPDMQFAAKEDNLPKKAAEPEPAVTEAPAEVKNPAEAPVKPTWFQKAPADTEKGLAEPATEEMRQQLEIIQTAKHRLDQLANITKQIQIQAQAKVREAEEQGQKTKFEQELQQAAERLAILVNTTQAKVVSFGSKIDDLMVKYEEKKEPITWSPAKKLAWVLEKVPAMVERLEHALNGAQSAAKEISRRLVFFPRKMSKLDLRANAMADLASANEDMLSALGLAMQLNQSIDKPMTDEKVEEAIEEK